MKLYKLFFVALFAILNFYSLEKATATEEEDAALLEKAVSTKPYEPLPEIEEPNTLELAPTSHKGKAAGIYRKLLDKWHSGETITFYFRDGTPRDREITTRAFRVWSLLGIPIRFKETTDPTKAGVRIGFEPGSCWSYVGTDVLKIADPKRNTMNLGWILGPKATEEEMDAALRTALVQVTHTLGFPCYSAADGDCVDFDGVTLAPRPSTTVFRPAGAFRLYRNPMTKPFIVLLAEESSPDLAGKTIADKLALRDVEWAKRTYKIERVIPLSYLASKRINLEPGEQITFSMSPSKNRQCNVRFLGDPATFLLTLFDAKTNKRLQRLEQTTLSPEMVCLTHALEEGLEYLIRIRMYYATGDLAVIWS